jgi:hypothetical protein
MAIKVIKAEADRGKSGVTINCFETSRRPAAPWSSRSVSFATTAD